MWFNRRVGGAPQAEADVCHRVESELPTRARPAPVGGAAELEGRGALDQRPIEIEEGRAAPRAPDRPAAIHLDDHGVALAAARADRGAAEAAATAPQLEHERADDAGARCADRVTERDGAAVDVDLVLVDAEHADRVQGDRGERLVDLPEVDVARAVRPALSSAFSAASAGVCAGRRSRRRPGLGDDRGERPACRSPAPTRRRRARARRRRR